MKIYTTYVMSLLAWSIVGTVAAWGQQAPLVTEETVFEERDGFLAVEAEHFFAQSETGKRKFYLTTNDQTPEVQPDGDPAHVGGASNGAYIEILPDTRRNHGQKLISGENFSPQPGKLAVVSYKVHINNPGRYFVWVRAYSTGSEDNGLHVGLDGQWPASGQRLQWCEGKNSWRWDSKQRTAKKHCGVPHGIYLDIAEAGPHVVQFSMREDGFEFDKWLITRDRDFHRPLDAGPATVVKSGPQPAKFPETAAPPEKPKLPETSPTTNVSDQPMQLPRKLDGNGSLTISGELKTWHKVTLDLAGPYAHEHDNQVNPFTDYRLTVTFSHPDGTTYRVPGYFAADGDAANSSAAEGTVWRTHFAPDRAGLWSYEIQFEAGQYAAIDWSAKAQPVPNFDGKRGTIEVAESDKTGRDFRAHGRLQVVGQRYLRHAGSGRYFLKFGADAPETLLAFKDFDNTTGGRKNAPLKSYQPHLADWQPGDPTWGQGKGKGLVGAVSYLSGKGANAFSFLTYNAGGDGNNVWPYVHRDDKLHFDCSKLDQWGIVFDFATRRGMYLHFKLQETEIDDHRVGYKTESKFVKESLDGGELGIQRKVYLKELVARFGHALALNWNLGEENTQSTSQVLAMIDYIRQIDAYDHNIVIHTYPDQQNKVYQPLLGDKSGLTGVSLQSNGIQHTHQQTLTWIRKSNKAKKPWIVAFDEAGTAAHGSCPDLGYQGFTGRDADGKMKHTQHEVRKQVLWGNLMAGGAGVEYYFGYKFPQNDLRCEDWRSRDKSWDYGRIAVGFFHDHDIPFVEMENYNRLIGNEKNTNDRFCFAKPGEVYVVYLASGSEVELELAGLSGSNFSVHWFNPRTGGELLAGSVQQVTGGGKAKLGSPPQDSQEDWVVLVRKSEPSTK